MKINIARIQLQRAQLLSTNLDILQRDIEELTKLIVQECIEVVQARYMGDNNREDMEVRRCVKALQSHWNIK